MSPLFASFVGPDLLDAAEIEEFEKLDAEYLRLQRRIESYSHDATKKLLNAAVKSAEEDRSAEAFDKLERTLTGREEITSRFTELRKVAKLAMKAFWAGEYQPFLLKTLGRALERAGQRVSAAMDDETALALALGVGYAPSSGIAAMQAAMSGPAQITSGLLGGSPNGAAVVLLRELLAVRDSELPALPAPLPARAAASPAKVSVGIPQRRARFILGAGPSLEAGMPS